MSWYRTYRPQTVAGLHITPVREAMLSMLKAGKIPHALLFAGPKGTGKTSSARIIAKVLNCQKNSEIKPGKPLSEPCNECIFCTQIMNGSSLNVQEMDGASNRRIDDIRQLKDSLYMPPANGRYTVIIIDEVHMLTREAFNALLKMLEEPPAHAIFIFATTEPHKIPDTVISRCTTVSFRTATDDEVMTVLSQIVKKEKLKVEAEALQQIASLAGGSFRDAVKELERRAASKDGFSGKKGEHGLLALDQATMARLVSAIINKDQDQVISMFQTARQQDVDAIAFHKALLQFLHQDLIKNYDDSDGKSQYPAKISLYLLKQFNAVEIPLTHPVPLLPLELCALEMILKAKERGSSSSGGQDKKTVAKNRPSSQSPAAAKQATSLVKAEVLPETLDSISPANPELESVMTVMIESSSDSEGNVSFRDPEISQGIDVNSRLIDGELLGSKWNEFLKTIGRQNLSIEAILRSAKFIRGEEGRAIIQVYYQFHKEQLELNRYREVIDGSIQQLFGGTIKCEYVLSSQSAKVADSVHANISGDVEKEDLESVIDEVLM